MKKLISITEAEISKMLGNSFTFDTTDDVRINDNGLLIPVKANYDCKDIILPFPEIYEKYGIKAFKNVKRKYSGRITSDNYMIIIEDDKLIGGVDYSINIDLTYALRTHTLISILSMNYLIMKKFNTQEHYLYNTNTKSFIKIDTTDIYYNSYISMHDSKIYAQKKRELVDNKAVMIVIDVPTMTYNTIILETNKKSMTHIRLENDCLLGYYNGGVEVFSLTGKRMLSLKTNHFYHCELLSSMFQGFVYTDDNLDKFYMIREEQKYVAENYTFDDHAYLHAGSKNMYYVAFIKSIDIYSFRGIKWKLLT